MRPMTAAIRRALRVADAACLAGDARDDVVDHGCHRSGDPEACEAFVNAMYGNNRSIVQHLRITLRSGHGHDIVRAALLQTDWTGAKESMIDKHEAGAREAAEPGRPGHLLPGAVLRPVLLPGAGRRVLRLHRGDPRRPDHAALPVRGQGARHGDRAADVRDDQPGHVLQHRGGDRRRRHLPRQVPQAAHPAGEGLLGEVLLHARQRAATRSSTPPSARSACTSATTATSPRAGGRSASTAPRSCSTRRPPVGPVASTSGGSSSRPPRWRTCTTSAPSTASASRPLGDDDFYGPATSSTPRASSSATSATPTAELIVRDLDLDTITEVRNHGPSTETAAPTLRDLVEA